VIEMPKTKLQKLIFTAMMVIAMVYWMTFYNLALDEGLRYETFWLALKEMWVEALAAFAAVHFLVNPLVRKRVNRLLPPGTDKPLLVNVAMAGCTVSMMAPLMTLLVNIYRNGIGPDIVLLWLPKLVLNFPFALCIQIFFVGPFIRWAYAAIFERNAMVYQPSPAVLAERE
jgi:hypothetical protein